MNSNEKTNTIRIFTKNQLREKKLKMEEVHSNTNVNKFDKKLFKKYFKQQKYDESGVLIKVYKQEDDSQHGDNVNKNENVNYNNLAKDLLKRKAVSPQPKAIYFGIKRDAFFNKREGVLKPDVKFRIVNLLYKHMHTPTTISKQKHSSETVYNRDETTQNIKAYLKLSKMKYTKNRDNETISDEIQKGSNEARINTNQKYEKIKNRRKRFANLSGLFESNKYESRIKLNSTFSKFNNIISDDEIQKYGEKIWLEAHKKNL